MADTKRTKITDYTPDPANPNRHTPRGVSMLEDSVSKVGVGRSIVVDKNGYILAGNSTTERLVDQGFEDAIEVETDGRQLVVVRRTDLDLMGDEQRARLLSYYDNRTAEVGLSWDAEQLMADVASGMDFDGLFTGDELALLTEVDDPTPTELFEIDKSAQPSPRQLPIDAIFTLYRAKMYSPIAMAHEAGFLYGIQSCKSALDWEPHYEVSFVDNEYFNYDHEIHAANVARFKPKYATTRDIMSRAQCKEAGIKYYSLEEILDYAAEIEEHAENVIVIPKYDCLDQIPEHYVLGYSVPTSHGGTPLPPEAFKGRRVHLLGGSWKAQLAHMAILGEDVVSVDNNYIMKAAQFGSFCYPDGTTGTLNEDLGLTVNNHLAVAMAISLGSIGAKLNEIYSHAVEVPA